MDDKVVELDQILLAKDVRQHILCAKRLNQETIAPNVLDDIKRLQETIKLVQGAVVGHDAAA